jgi:hypothetical protein
MKTLIIALCLIAAAATASTVACVTGRSASYGALFGGCSIGDAVFSNFSGLSFVNAGVPVFTASNIEVTPSGISTDPTLTFQYLNTDGVLTPVTVNTSGEIFSLGLSFDVVVSPAALTGIKMSSMFSNTMPGSISASKTAQWWGATVGPSTVSSGGVSNPAATYSGAIIPMSGVGTVLTSDTMSLQTQCVIPSTNEFSKPDWGTDPTATAEGGSFAMVGSGLIVVGLIARRRGKRVPLS